MTSIGGYFELELYKGGHHYHDTPYLMKSGRSALHYMLAFLKPTLVYIPYYTCDALLAPFKTTGIPYEFYQINELLEPKELIDLQPGQYFLYVNYLDLKRDTVAMLSEQYKDKLIVDCTQAFFMKGNNVSWFFNSCRKFFGVPDGSYLYTPAGTDLPVFEAKNEDYIIDHLLQRFNGHAAEGYDYFLKNEVLAGNEIAAMSKLSAYLLSAINYNEVMKKRCANYKCLHDRLEHINLFDGKIGNDTVPMCYPLLLPEIIDKNIFFSENVFIPTFWKDVLSRGKNGFEIEEKISTHLLPLPIDHRYTTDDMKLLYNSLANIIQ